MTTDDLDTTHHIHRPKMRKLRTRSIVSWLALLAILIAIGAWFQLVHQQKKSRNNYSQLQNSFSQTQSNTAELSTDVTALKTQLKDQNEVLVKLTTAFNRSQAAHFDQAIDNNLMAVDHYLVQANLSLNFNHNIRDAILLLKTADLRLIDMTDPGITRLRSQIAADLVKLQAINPLDQVGILTQIAAIQNQVPALPLFATANKIPPFKANDPASSQQGSWLNQSLHVSLETLKSLVIIRHRQQHIEPLLAPMQEQFLRQNLQLMLQQASWAALEQNSAVYLFSLNQAQTWLQRYFADNDQATHALSEQLKTLMAININPIVPDLSLLLQTLHDLQVQYAENLAVMQANNKPTNLPLVVPSTAMKTANIKPSHPAQAQAGEVI